MALLGTGIPLGQVTNFLQIVDSQPDFYKMLKGRGEDVIPNINDPLFRENELSPRLDQLEYYKRLHRKKLWMGETGGAFNSGQNTTTNTFMSHRWYLDQLGFFARRGHEGGLATLKVV